MRWFIKLIQRTMPTHSQNHEEIIEKADRIITGKDKVSLEMSKQKDQFTTDLLLLGKRAKMVTRRANDTTYFIARVTGGLA